MRETLETEDECFGGTKSLLSEHKVRYSKEDDDDIYLLASAISANSRIKELYWISRTCILD